MHAEKYGAIIILIQSLILQSPDKWMALYFQSRDDTAATSEVFVMSGDIFEPVILAIGPRNTRTPIRRRKRQRCRVKLRAVSWPTSLLLRFLPFHRSCLTRFSGKAQQPYPTLHVFSNFIVARLLWSFAAWNSTLCQWKDDDGKVAVIYSGSNFLKKDDVLTQHLKIPSRWIRQVDSPWAFDNFIRTEGVNSASGL